MKQATLKATYDVHGANRLLPLLRAIGREIEERTNELEALELRLEGLSRLQAPEDVRRLVAEAATHRRELRLAREELSRFGCQVLGTAPLTIRIPGRQGETKKSFVWQAGDPAFN